MISKAIILGNHIQGLGVSRICKRLGLEVFLYNDSPVCLTRFSNTCDHFYQFRQEFDLLEKLMQLPVEAENAILMPTNDKMVGFMADHYDQLAKKFFMSIPKPEITDICFDKIKTYKTAKSLGIPIPESHFPENLNQVQELASKLKYPVIIKPAVMFRFYHQVGKKVFLCEDPEQLVYYYQEAIRVIDPSEIIIQEFLDGGARNLFSYGSFCSGEKVWGSFVANRIRQKPMNFGISTTFAKTVKNKEIEAYAHKMLTGIKYFGLSEVEFMYDHKSGDFKLIEINPRTWKWHTITNKLGINLIGMLISYANQQPIKEQHNQQEDQAWIERLTDTYIVANEILKGRMSLADYLQSLKYPKEAACFSWKDPLPGIMYLVLTPYLYYKR
ncbi:MAG: ATP-grasp domain-containing protein [Candidatus Cyclobacteriaceae bacterium M3_2C_046]